MGCHADTQTEPPFAGDYRLLRLLLALSLLFLGSQSLATTIIASTGDAAPGFPGGASYTVFFGVSTSPDGRIALFGQTDAGRAVWAGQPDNLRLVIRQGDTIAGLQGARFDGLPTTTPIIARNGDTAFLGQVSAGTQSGQALVARLRGRVLGVARVGAPIAGASSEEPVRSLSDVRLTRAGLAFRASVGTELGLWFHDGTELRRIASPGESFDGACEFSDTFVAGSISLNEAGALSFVSRTRPRDGAPAGTDCPRGLFVRSGGRYELRLQEGELPGITPAVRLTSITRTFINNAGDVALSARTRFEGGTSSQARAGLWVLRAGATLPELYALEGETIGTETFGGTVANLFDAISSGEQWITNYTSTAADLFLRGAPRGGAVPTAPVSRPSQLRVLVASGGPAPRLPVGLAIHPARAGQLQRRRQLRLREQRGARRRTRALAGHGVARSGRRAAAAPHLPGPATAGRGRSSRCACLGHGGPPCYEYRGRRGEQHLRGR